MMDEQMTPAETIRTALHCANGECAIDEPDYQRALAWLAGLERVALPTSWERVGVLALKLDDWAEIFNSRALTDIASELLVLAQSKIIAAGKDQP